MLFECLQPGRLLGLCLLASAMSCASIVSPPDQVDVETDPAGAAVICDGEILGQTPMKLEVPTGWSSPRRNFVLELPGYHPQPVELSSSFNGWFLGNAALGGVLGIAVDLLTGAVVDTATTPVYVQMTPLSAPPPGPFRPRTKKKASGDPQATANPEVSS